MLKLFTSIFAKRGKNQAGQTYTCSTFGEPTSVVSEEGKVSTKLTYKTKGIREAEVRKIVDSLNLDILECIMRGADYILKAQASLGSSAINMITSRLIAQGISADNSSLKVWASKVVGDYKGGFFNSLEDSFKAVVDNLSQKGICLPYEAATDNSSESEESESEEVELV